MSRIATKLVAIGLYALVVIASAQAQQDLISFADVQGSYFNPSRDVATVRYTLDRPATSVSVIVFAADSVTPVDTLRAPAPDTIAGSPPKTFDWDGDQWDGAPAPEGLYIATITAVETLLTETVRLPVRVDRTSPSVQIIGHSPIIYAPGVSTQQSTLNIEFNAWDLSPWALGDELTISFFNPNNAPNPPDTLFFAPPIEVVGSRYFLHKDTTYTMKWDASGQSGLIDGIWRVRMHIVDAASNQSNTSEWEFNLDNQRPALTYLNIGSGDKVSVVPDSLRAFTWDRNGIKTDSLMVRYGDNGLFEPVTQWHVRDDTVFFAITLADSIVTEGSHTLVFRTHDTPGNVTTSNFDIEYDTSGPNPPTLVPFNGPWYTDSFPLRGAFNIADGNGVLRIYRNGIQIDSLFTILQTDFERRVPLLVGTNQFTATLVDDAKNESAPAAEEVIVEFSSTTGLFVNSPFYPGDEFQFNLAEVAESATLRVYDLTGDLVVKLDDLVARDGYLFVWDGRNTDAMLARRGPLVAVATVKKSGGGSESFREIFLFNPDR